MNFNKNLAHNQIINEEVQIKEILKVCNLCIKTKVNSPSLHAYYLYVLSNYDLKNAYFVWEDAGSNINRIFCDITRVYGKGSEGYI